MKNTQELIKEVNTLIEDNKHLMYARTILVGDKSISEIVIAPKIEKETKVEEPKVEPKETKKKDEV